MIIRTEKFLREVVIRELGKMQSGSFDYMQFVVMGQAIEVLGGFLDHKPIKSRGQASRRFEAAVNCLLGGKYRLWNENGYLYQKLRNQMTHTFLSSPDVLLLNWEEGNETYRHLEKKDGRLVLISGVFYRDICRACERLLALMKEGVIKPKNIAFGDEK